ncbi:beta-ketoacyl-[acyl-carrier-protein] synthase family protein [Streptomyces sp. NRRL_ISP-5395]|uniref:beta-ketoacyl-[acyl-carrier-protein] synthase family protein n=1 Tax=Streptomyces TaxID=1883 RepID=UPI0019BEADD9|nr:MULTISPECIES: beta-ketoacyl-[acyl-carrier-protein] synthase family protein [Streptomyces]MDX2669873.1 beta-ketoacyl-[acyl-carrier-protein] synthase family protein [Streptomyces sp. NRRL_ISP-5395]GHF81056.1 actinorhodin polyketide putative beta-ketoacyl synthase 1 [Streptomyces griseus]
MERRAVITGIGVCAPGGTGADSFWELMCDGRTATRGITLFDPSPYRSRVAAEIDFDPRAHGLTPQEVRRMDRAAQFGVVTAREAFADSGLDGAALDPFRTGVSLGTAIGAAGGLDAEYRVVSDDGRLELVDHRYATPHLYDLFVPSSFATEVAWAVGAEGPATVVSTGCTAGIDAVGHAVEAIRDGSADVMVTGAVDAPITPLTMAAFDAIRATTSLNDEADTASRPFDASRKGFVLGEGAAVFVLEEAEHARRRGAYVYAEIAGYASRGNAFHMTGLRSDGAELAAAIRAALDEARLDASAVDYVNAHGSGTRQNDRHETVALKSALGQHAHRVPVSAIKSMVGHSLGAIGSIEIAACALAMRHHVIPPTANLHTPDPECDLDYVPLTARAQRTDAVLTIGSGFGGFQSAMVLARPDRSVA